MWSPQQNKAIDQVGAWLKSRDKPFFQLAGYAGTGKTTLAKHLAQSVSGPVYFAAFTGKAAHVLSQSGASNVSTIHKLIYSAKDKSKQRLKDLQRERADLLTKNPIPKTMLERLDKAINEEKANLSRPSFQLNLESPLTKAGLLVVDEYSMINEQMGEDLLSFGCPVLALGDPGQLPPVYGQSFFSGKPDILLTEIHRQAQDNPIIQLSKQVRERQELKPGKYGETVVYSQGASREQIKEEVLATDQLLVGKNQTRVSSNNRIRELLGFSSPTPVVNDRLVCLRNNHELGLLNGQLWKVVEDPIIDDDHVFLMISSEDGDRVQVEAHLDYFYGNKPEFWVKSEAEEFDYGYALTVHKAQGSQWDSVLLFDEWYSKDRHRWLYTAITRAARKISIIPL